MSLDFKNLNLLLRQKCASLSTAVTNQWVYVSIERQQLWLVIGDQPLLHAPCSTSRNPPSCLADSYGTPTGIHAIAAKIGDGAPSGAVFKGRVCTADHFSQLPSDEQAGNLITTRILRLKGLEPDLNARPLHNAWERFIYLHGTNHSEKIGTPFSAGCILINDKILIQLFDLLDINDLVWIQ
jgi:hypothetical protein